MPLPVRTLSEVAVGRLRPSISPAQPDPAGYLQMLNCWAAPRTDGTIESVPGYRSISTASEDLRQLIYAKASDDTKLLLAVGATQLWSVSLADDATFGNFTSLATGLTYGQEVAWVIYKDAIYLFNGTLPKKVTVAASPVVSNPGLARPDMATFESEGGITFTKVGTGNIHGVVKYFISEVTESGGDVTEGALSVASADIDTKNKPDKIEIDFIPANLTTPSDMANKDFRVYRTYADGEDPFYVDTIEVGASGSTYTLVDNVPDVGEDGLGDPPLLHGDEPPSGLTTAVMHLERVWGADGSDLYYSDVKEPESWFTSPEGQLISVFKNDGDVITALGSSREGLVIWKRDHMYIVLGRVEEELVVDRITQSHQQTRNIGAPSANAVAAIPSGFAFYWKRALYTYIRGRITRVSPDIESDLGPNLDKFEDQVHVGYDSFNGRVWLSVPLSGSVGSDTYFYSLRLQRWVGRMERGHKAYQYIEDANDNLRLWALGTS